MEQEKKTNWLVVFVAVLGGIVAALYVGKMPPAIAFIQSDIGLDLVEGGYVISVFNLIGVSLAMIIGTTVDKLNKHRLILISFFTIALGGFIGSFADSFYMLLASRIIEGSGYIFIVVAMPALVVAASSDKDRALALSIWSTFTPVGMVVGLVSFPFLEANLQWQGAWQVYGLLPILICGAVLLSIRNFDMPGKSVGNILELVRQTLSQKGLWLLALAFAGYVLQWVSLMVWLPTFLTEDLSFEKSIAALVTAGIIAMNIPSNILGGWMMRKGYSASSLVLCGSILMGVFVVGIFQVPMEDSYRILCCFAFSLVGGVIPASLFAFVPKCAPSPSHMSASSGMLMQGSAIGQFVGPPLLAYAVSLGGGEWASAVYPMLLGALVTSLAGWLVTRP